MKEKTQSKKSKSLLVWALLIVLFVSIFYLANSGSESPTRVDFTIFKSLADRGQINEMWIDGNQVYFRMNGSHGIMMAVGQVSEKLEQSISEKDVPIHNGRPETEGRMSGYLGVLIWLCVVLIVLALVLRYLAKRQQGAFGDMFSLRKSRATLAEEVHKAKFADVGGCDDAKLALADIVDFLKNPKPWTDAGARLPRGVLLEGPSGCGKTLLARAVAGETDANFYVVSASEFVEMFAGVGAARVRDMFETAAKNLPAIIFIDELDAVGRRRGSGTGPGHEEREQTLNQLLVNLDGFKGNDRIVVLAATNRSDILDPALMRPGRFDRIVRVPGLSCATRESVLAIHLQKKPLAADVSLADLAERTEGFSGAQLESLTNEAALLAVRRTNAIAKENGAADQPPAITHDDFLAAFDAVRPESSSCDKLDEVLVEAVTQLARPKGTALARLTLADGSALEGEVLWANAAFIKIRPCDSGPATIVAKRHITMLESLEVEGLLGESVAVEIAGDAWGNRAPEVL